MHPIQNNLLKLIEKENIGELSLHKIAAKLGETSPQKIKHHLIQLERKGLIVNDRQRKIIRKVDHKKDSNDVFILIPILGSASCGEPSRYADEHVEGYLKISRSLLKKPPGASKFYALKAVGISMNDADIEGNSIDDGDYVIVDSKIKKPNNNDYVVSVIDGLANIKKFVHDKGNRQIVLISESSKKQPPIYIHEDDYRDYMICGKIIQVIKKPAN